MIEYYTASKVISVLKKKNSMISKLTMVRDLRINASDNFRKTRSLVGRLPFNCCCVKAPPLPLLSRGGNDGKAVVQLDIVGATVGGEAEASARSSR